MNIAWPTNVISKLSKSLEKNSQNKIPRNIDQPSDNMLYKYPLEVDFKKK